MTHLRSLGREFAALTVLTALGAAYSLFAGWSPLPWEPPPLAAGEIRPADATLLDPIWLDARSPEAHAADHIPGAIFFDPQDWDASLPDLMEAWLPAPRPIVVYCGSQSCATSREIAEYLRAALPEAEIYSLKGGWDAWTR